MLKLIENKKFAQNATRWKPYLWPKSSQRSTLVPMIRLGGEEKQQWCHLLCTTDVWTCRGPLVQALWNRWFASSLSHKSKCPTWHPTQWSTLLCHWMHLNANATWQSWHGNQDDLILSAIQAKWPPKSRHQRNSRQILQNRATESRRACSKTIIANSPIRGFFDTDSFMSYVYEHHCFIGIFVGPLNTNCIKYQANQKLPKLELSWSRGKFKERKQEGLQRQGHLW